MKFEKERSHYYAAKGINNLWLGLLSLSLESKFAAPMQKVCRTKTSEF